VRPSNETIRVADQAVVDWLSGLRVDYGLDTFPNRDLRDTPIFCVFATPERAFAEMRYLLIQRGFVSPNTDGTEGRIVGDDELYKHIPFPFCRIQRSDVSPVTELHSTPNEFVTFSQGFTFTKSRWPTPYEISYAVEFVSKARFTDNFITEWIVGQFTPLGMGVNQRLIRAVYPTPYGEKDLTLTFTGSSDASELEVQGPTDRRIRTTFNLTLRVWDVDLVGKSVKAVAGVETSFRNQSDADLALNYHGTVIEDVPVRARRVYSHRPVPERHSFEHSTATKGVKYHNAAQPYIIDSNTDAVETPGIPFLPVDMAQAAVHVKWRRCDGEAAVGGLRAQVLWRDSQASFTPTVVSETLLPYADGGAVLNYQSIPGSEFRELSVRFLRPTDGPDLTVALAAQVVYTATYTNLLPPQDQQLGPNMGAAADITLTGLLRAEAYLVRGWVQYSDQPVTVSVYKDAGATELVASRVFTGNGEFTAVVSPSNSQLVLIRVTTATPDADLEVTGITVTRCMSTPLFMP
jgi:hypothetical protein